MDFNEELKVRPVNQDCEEWTIMFGKYQITNKCYKTREEAQEKVDGIDWNIVANFVAIMINNSELIKFKKN